MAQLPPLEEYSREDLLRLYGAVMARLRELGYVRSGNNPVADVAERLVADMYGAPLASANTAGHDLVAKDGTKIQVKGLRKTQPGRKNLSAIRSKDYDVVVAVVFEADMTVSELWRVPREVVEEKARWSDHVNGYFLSLKREVCDDDRVERIPLEALKLDV
jgi:hypothetical protein